METRPISALISQGLFMRTLVPAVLCLLVLAAYLGFEQKRTVERRNEELATLLSHYAEEYISAAWRPLERFTDEVAGITGEPEARLREMVAILPNIDRLVRISPDNTILSAVPMDERGLDFPLAFDNRKGRRLILSHPLQSSSSGESTVFIGILDKRGGILAGELSLKDLSEQIRHFSKALKGSVIVCDSYGNVVSHPDRDLVEQQANLGSSPLFKAAKAGRKSLVYSEDGRFYLGSWEIIPDLGWLVMVRADVLDSFMPALAPLGAAAVATALVFILIVVIVVRAMDRGIARPLTDAAARIGDLSPTQRYVAGPRPAFEELAGIERAVADMTGRIGEGREALRLSEKRFRAIFEQAAVGLTQCTPEGTIVTANKRFQDIVVRDRSELEGKDLQSITHPDDAATDLGLRARLKAGEIDTFAQEKRYLTGTGGSVWVRFTCAAVRGKGGKIEYLIGVSEDITARKHAEEALRSSLGEKEVLLREIHHRVKNNLQIISSLLYLQSEELTDPGTLELFRESRSRISSMALVHEELYRSGDLSSVNMHDYAHKLVPRLVAAFSSPSRVVHCSLEAQEVSIPIDQAIPLGLILNELVTNTVKHAFKGREQGNIRVLLRKVDSRMEVDVIDDGIGMPADFDLDKAHTLGMQLISQLTKQLRGELRIATGEGACVRVSFPVKE